MIGIINWFWVFGSVALLETAFLGDLGLVLGLEIVLDTGSGSVALLGTAFWWVWASEPIPFVIS